MLACVLVAAAMFLAGMLGSSWFAVLEALQNAVKALQHVRGYRPAWFSCLGSQDRYDFWYAQSVEVR